MIKNSRSLSISFFSIFVLTFLIITVTTSWSIGLNDNVNVAGELFLDGNNCGMTYPDGSRQTTASVPPWCQLLPSNERFILVMNDEAVLDRETGLVWERNTSDTTQDWVYAQMVCRWATIGGRNGWRLPTIDELSTLYVGNTSGLPNGHPFTNAKSSLYWSTTTSVGYNDNTDYAWCVDFSGIYGSNGSTHANVKTGKHYVRAVRASQ